MQQLFDFFNYPEYPYIILCNPDKTEIFSLGLAFETNLIKRFNALSEFSFKFPKSIDGGQTSIEAYDYLNNKRLIKIEGYGYFQIVNSEEDSDGAVPIRTVSCESLETELIQKKITAFGGTKKLWDINTPEETILYEVIHLSPNWSVGNIDTLLLTKYRTFEVSDSTVYNFLMDDVAKAFDCVFIFDTDLRTISANSVSSSTTTSDIFLSFDNIIKSSKFSEKSDEIVTCLSVYGGGDLNIRGVNPLGTNNIYNFSYYKTTEWMSQNLIDAITTWENLVSSNQSSYSDFLALLRGYNLELIILQSDLLNFRADLSVLETTKKGLIESKGDLTSINSQMIAKQSQIDSQIILIANKQTQVDSTMSSLVNINNLVSLDTSFTPSQLLELDNFIFQNTYKDENIIQTDIMTSVETQDAEQDLYDKALVVLGKVSQPRYEIQVDSANYISLPEFLTFTNQTELGTEITCEINPNVFIQTVLLEMEMTFDDPENFSLLLSNRVRKDGAGFTYSDLMGQVVKTGSSVSFDSLKWSNWENHKDDVTTFITSSLNTTTNNLINNSNQEILINQNGLRGRTYNPDTNSYNPTQVWLTSSVMAFSDDGFATSKLALGSVNTSAGTKFGLIAEVIYGNLIAGNTLTISNTREDGQPSNFILDQTGATLYNAKFTISNANSRILLNPNDLDGRIFRIQKNEATIWTDKFWVDNVGNVNFSGNLSGASGSFSGTVSASQLLGTVDWSQIVNAPLPASKFNGGTGYSASGLTSGSMSGNRLYGGYITGSEGIQGEGGYFNISNPNLASLTGFAGLTLGSAGSNKLTINSNGSISLSSVTFRVSTDVFEWNGNPVATQTWANSAFTTQSWVNSQGFYKSGSNAYFSGVHTSSTYYASDGYSGATGNITFRDYNNSLRTIYFHDGLISSTI